MKLHLYFLGSIIFCISLFFSLQYTTHTKLGDPDGWYHLGISKLYQERNIGIAFPWLSQTILNDEFYDQQFLYHLILALYPAPVTAKITTTLLTLLVLASLALLLNTLKIRGANVWGLLALLGSSGFLFRANLVKGGLVGVALFIFTAWALLTKRWWMVAIIGVLWALSHGSFVLLIPLVLSYFICASEHTKKDIAIGILASISGIVLGLLLHPHHANLVPFLQAQLSVPFSIKNTIDVGNEWYPYNFQALVKYTFPLLPLWIGAAVFWVTQLLRKQDKKIRSIETWLWLISIGWFCAFLSSKRFIEYWAPLSIVPMAVTLAPYISRISFKKVVSLLKCSWQYATAVIILVALLGWSAWYNISVTYAELGTAVGVEKYQAATAWLSENSNPGDIVFNTRWDHFPQLFYLNPHNYYIVGLDTTFMYAHSPSRYWQWRTIVSEQPEQWSSETVYYPLQYKFRAQYVFIENSSTPALKSYMGNVGNSTEYLLVYTDQDTSIFKVLY